MAQNKAETKRLKNRWIICMASFIVQFIVFGIQNSFGILFVSLREEFKSSELATAWIGTLSFTLMYFLGPVMTISCRKFGCHFMTFAGSVLAMAGLFCSSYVSNIKLLFVTYGFALGIGTSMCFYSSLGVLNIHFKKRLSLAYGISMSGAGFGVPVIAKLSNFIISNSGWRKSVRLLSAAGPILFCCGLIFFTLTRCNRTERIKMKQSLVVWHQKYSIAWYKRFFSYILQFLKLSFDYEMFAKNKALRTWTLSLSLVLSGYLVPFVYLVRIADNIGVPRYDSALLIGYLAITQAVSKVIFGQIGNMGANSRVRTLQIFALLNAVNTTLCPLAMNYAFLVVFVVVFGICDGCFAVMFSMGTHSIVGVEDMARAFGNVCCIVAVVQAIGTPLAGLIYDVFGEYNVAFFISGGLSTMGVCIMFLVPIYLFELKDSDSKSSPQTVCQATKVNLYNSRDKDKEVFDEKTPASRLCSYGQSNNCMSNCVFCSDFISLSGCPRHSVWNPQPSMNWV